MLSTFEEMDYTRLRAVIRRVRNRWRLRVMLRGSATVLLASFIALVAFAYGLDFFRYRLGALFGFSVVIYIILLALLVRYLAIPLSQKVADERVALYIEENEPAIQAEILSAVEIGQRQRGRDYSPALVQRLIASAVERCQNIEFGRRVERGKLRKSSTVLASAASLILVAAVLSPAFLRLGAPLLLMPWSSTAFANPYGIDVLPGDAQVTKGSDQLVSANLVGFDSDRVEIAVKTAETGEWERWPMSTEEENDEYVFMLFGLEKRTEYFIEASGVRSPIFRLDALDLPYVQRIDLEYHFPDYSGLSPRLVEDGGDISALRGTEVSLRITPTFPVPAGRIIFEPDTTATESPASEPIELAVSESGTLETFLIILEAGTYRIELEGFNGSLVKASPDYFVEVLTDQPPTIFFDTPGRDTQVSPVDESFVELVAEDDYGLANLELVYSVNGGATQTLSLYQAQAHDKPGQELTASHTFYLEEEELEPGDFLSYYARATDNHGDQQPNTTTTDIYFMEVRPFSREYRQGQQGGGGGAGGQVDAAFAARQKQIVLATFKVIRDRDTYSNQQYESDLATLAMTQDRLRQQVELVLGRTTQRGVLQPGSDFQKLADQLRAAMAEMQPAHDSLAQQDPKSALPPEQRALQHLQRAEALIRQVQVNFGRGGGGGGGQSGVNEDLADLLDLEMEKLRNQYETVQRGQRQQLDEQLDEARQRLEELARRQQQQNERSQRLANLPSNLSGGNGGGQRQLAAQAEDLARQLERLSREQSQPDLMETARRLRQAADAMRRAAASSDDGASSEGIAAMNSLQRARDLLNESRTRRLQRDMQELRDNVEKMKQQQVKIARDVRGLGERNMEAADRQRMADQMDRVLERKDELAAQAKALEGQTDRMARDYRREQKEASRKLQAAASWMRDSKLADKIRYSKGVTQQRLGGYADRFEEQIGNDLEHLSEMLAEASASIDQSDRERLASSLEQTRKLVRKLESLEERMRQNLQQGQQSQEGQQSQQGQQEGQGQGDRAGQPQGQQRGARSGEAALGNRTRQGAPRGTGGPPGNPRDILRQYRREFRERVGDLEALREQLAQEGQQVSDLDAILAAMRDLRLDGTPRGIDELRSKVTEDLKLFEYFLRRLADRISGKRPYLSTSDQVPDGYRKLVEEYYRALARDPGH
ncbi:MAG: hypothetical protein ACE5HV_00715 [Acidobacteriota bacterium]